MKQCQVCQRNFEPSHNGNFLCSNTCAVRLFTARQKVRLSIKAALKALKTPEDVNNFNLSLTTIIEKVAQ
ncbi:hypothetical protein [Pseudomonas rhodesiae]|uniref:hypothetical protein n=1 Tax=Pseudomonas rhodesiae TaxID=76760 RepID=UPI0032B1E5A9